MSEEEKKEYIEAKLYLEHTGVDDFNLEKHQRENRIWAIETVLKLVEKQQEKIDSLEEIINNQQEEIGFLKSVQNNLFKALGV